MKRLKKSRRGVDVKNEQHNPKLRRANDTATTDPDSAGHNIVNFPVEKICTDSFSMSADPKTVAKRWKMWSERLCHFLRATRNTDRSDYVEEEVK